MRVESVMISYQCRRCGATHEATADDLYKARRWQRRVTQSDTDVMPAETDQQLMDGFGRKLCPVCTPGRFRQMVYRVFAQPA